MIQDRINKNGNFTIKEIFTVHEPTYKMGGIKEFLFIFPMNNDQQIITEDAEFEIVQPGAKPQLPPCDTKK